MRIPTIERRDALFPYTATVAGFDPAVFYPHQEEIPDESTSATASAREIQQVNCFSNLVSSLAIMAFDGCFSVSDESIAPRPILCRRIPRRAHQPLHFRTRARSREKRALLGISRLQHTSAVRKQHGRVVLHHGRPLVHPEDSAHSCCWYVHAFIPSLVYPTCHRN